MADGSLAPAEDRRTFLITAQAETDILMRVLAPFAVQSARIVAADLAERGGQVTMRIEVMGLCPIRADTLADRLRGMPAVVEVGQVWRAGRSVAVGTHTIL